MDEKFPPGYTVEQESQRSSLRAPLIVEKVPCQDGQKTFFGYAKNISSGGLFISTVKPREPGEQVTIEITLPMPGKPSFRCLCEVVWKRHFHKKSPYEPGMGLKFIDLPKETAETIDTWVKHQLATLS
ncbi:MAG TPA: PilZ domain-containing protein [Desulfuromonadales bacterium]|nr:PilZ domain-containing protein [Desulfuromonadales bacterium]